MHSGAAGDDREYTARADSTNQHQGIMRSIDLDFDISDFISNHENLEFYARNNDFLLQPNALAHRADHDQGNVMANLTHAGPSDQASCQPAPATTEMLKNSLYEQLKLQQQVQQLQNQILQGKIDALNGQKNSRDALRIPGLMTPVSLDLAPTIDNDHVSPMFLQDNGIYSSDPTTLLNALLSPAMTPMNPNIMSAPASIAFANSNHSTPGNEFFSPLTSPALGPMHYTRPSYPASSSMAAQQTPHQPQPHPHPHSYSHSATSSPNLSHHTPLAPRQKRRASPDDSSNRKRVSMMKAPDTNANANNRRTRASGSRRGSLQGSSVSPLVTSVEDSVPHSTPSPVDFVMPPPAPPPSSTDTLSQSQNNTPGASPCIAPVTPASIMNLSHVVRRPAGLIPQLNETGKGASQPGILVDDQARQPKRGVATKGKAPVVLKPKPATTSSQTPGVNRSGTVGRSPALRPTASPALKPLLPGGVSADAATSLSLKSNLQNILEGRAHELGISTSLTSDLSGGFEIRKHSHKAAEQKRRDSLKSGFDDLRLLLPPIALDPDSLADRDEPPVPGSAPPRGPPRNIGPGAEDHPNRGVSKLALLRNSNEYIVMLQRRVQRRDGALGRMREEVECLKGLVRGFEGGKEKLGERVWGEWDDDLDAIEKEVEEERERLGAARPTERLRAGIGASTTTTASVATLAQIQQQNDITEESGGVNRDDG